MTRKRWYGPPLKPGDPRHGTNNGYQNYACRCDPCRAAHYEYHKGRGYGERYRRRLGMVSWAEHVARLPTPEHGTRTSYKNGCRCADCTQAERDYRRAYRAGRRATR